MTTLISIEKNSIKHQENKHPDEPVRFRRNIPFIFGMLVHKNENRNK